MLGRPRKAHHSSHERVVAAVGSLVGIRGDQFIEAMRRPLAPVYGDIKAEPSQARRRHRDQQCRLALAPGLKIRKPLADELVAWKIGGHSQHALMVEGVDRRETTAEHTKSSDPSRARTLRRARPAPSALPARCAAGSPNGHQRDPSSTDFGPRSKGAKGVVGQYRPMTRSLSNSMPSTPRRFLLLPEESLNAPGRGPRIRRYRLASVARRSGPGSGDRSPRRPAAGGEGQ
jgi:hypothetical protein